MMRKQSTRWQFALFFLSGFSGLVYQVVWLRLAFAAFGVVTPVISLVLSVFMFGLGAGSWFAGTAVRRWPLSRENALRAYAIAEFLIGTGGIAVPLLFAWGEEALLPAGESDSVRYLASSAVVILLSLAPFCLCMGVTFPFMLQAIRAEQGREDSFSYLYLANVLGAILGTLATPLVLVELLGFRGTLAVAIAANWIAALVSLRKSLKPTTGVSPESRPEAGALPETATPLASRFALCILFATGLTSLGMEVVWTRAFTPVLKTQVYSFAGLLFAYLLATWCGSALYRRHLARKGPLSLPVLLSLLSLAAAGQLLLADPRAALPGNWMQSVWLLLGIAPYCGILGYLTPKLIDEYSRGRPGPAGHAYAINVVGCIAGPLLASYVLLPLLGVQWSGVVLAAPLWLLAGLALRSRPLEMKTGSRGSPTAARGIWAGAVICGILAATVGTSYEDQYGDRGAIVMRDHTATVIAVEESGGKQLLVNGKLITSITPTTKIMAHLPLAHLSGEPQSALVICFGMGTTYRSLLSWDIETTAVELVPSVRDAFGYYFDDAEQVRNNPLGRIVIDDGRRFLRRTDEQFDVITLDPPPPPEAAGSSLLYSREFYQLVRSRLTDQGILHQWYPGGDRGIFLAVVRTVVEEFDHVRVFRGFDGWGYHILASDQPIPQRSVEEVVARLPDAARSDLLEWSAGVAPHDLFRPVLESERKTRDIAEHVRNIGTPTITDDRPYNEYYLLRRGWEHWTGSYTIVL